MSSSLSAYPLDIKAPTQLSRPRRWTLLVFFAGLALGLVFLASPLFHAASGFSEEEHIAIHLAHGDGFLSPFDMKPTAAPTSWCPPIYPLLAGAIYRILGVRTWASALTILIFNFACRAAAAAALFRLGSRLFNRATGLLAAAILLSHPIFLNAALFCWDNNLALAMFLWLLVVAIELPRPTPAHLAGIAAAAGTLALTNAAYVLSFPVIVWLAAKNGEKKPALFALAAASFALTLLPWTARNFAEFNRLFFVRANFPVELWLGNQPFSTGNMTLQTLAAHPSSDPASQSQILQLGEMAYFDLCEKRFIQEFSAAPIAFFARCGNRLAYLWISQAGAPRATFDCLLAILGSAGAILAWHQPKSRLVLIAGFLAVAPYLVTQVHDRYVMPFRAILILFAAALLQHAASQVLRVEKHPE
jgi:4-amino-4-deoxy-L-arabinose transferase-like glycosyltransferase